ncbi:MAG: TolC family protein [Candidatus Kapabacteria bacterium]|nr:TolC family protein [Candidatus Kapabacteria bacterium]
MLKLTLKILLLLVFAENLGAQSLDSLIKEAMKNNPMLMSLGTRVRSAEFRVSGIDVLPAPTIGLELSNVPFNSLNYFSAPLSQNLTFSQMFHLGGKLEAMSNAEKMNVNLGQDNIDIYKVNLAANIKMIYYNLWLLNEKIALQKENILILNNLLSTMQNLYEANKLSQADILALKSEIATNETQIIVLENQIEPEKYKMNKLLGRNLGVEFVMNGDNKMMYEDGQKNDANEIRENLEHSPTIKKMNTMIEMNEKDMLANDKDRAPDLMLQGMLMRMPQGMIVTANNATMSGGSGKADYGYSLMASVTLPFAPWSKNKYDAKEQELEANIQSIESEKLDMQREMITAIRSAFAKKKTNEELKELYLTKLLPLYEQTRKSQISQYQNNMTNINSVIDAARMFQMQKMNYIMAVADYKMAEVEIEMMVGNGITK